MSHRYFGSFDGQLHDSWEGSATIAGRTVRLSLLAYAPVTTAQLDALEALARDVERLDSVARAALAERVNDEDSTGGYIRHHLDELAPDALVKAFSCSDKASITPAFFLERMGLKSVNLRPSGPCAVLDYTLEGDVTQYVLAVVFDDTGTLTYATMES